MLAASRPLRRGWVSPAVSASRPSSAYAARCARHTPPTQERSSRAFRPVIPRAQRAGSAPPGACALISARAITGSDARRGSACRRATPRTPWRVGTTTIASWGSASMPSAWWTASRCRVLGIRSASPTMQAPSSALETRRAAARATSSAPHPLPTPPSRAWISQPTPERGPHRHANQHRHTSVRDPTER